MQITGTNHFVSKVAADRYYHSMGYPDADDLISGGEIHIGPPSLLSGETFSIIHGEGRYQVIKGDKPAVVVSRNLSLLEEIALLVVDGNKVVLPEEHLRHYADIKRLLETSGGRYDAKGYFSFAPGIDVDQVMQSLSTGKAKNGKKESQSFFTPPDLGNEVCRAAGPLEGKRVLEPSGGHGALADIAEAAGAEVVVVENYPPNVIRLQEKGYDVIARDFLTVTPAEIGLFDACVANPPFTKNQDIDHVLHMWTFLKPGGTLSAVMSQSWLSGSQKKQRLFREFLDERNAEIVEIEAGVFKESGTTVSTVRIRVQKEVEVAKAVTRSMAPAKETHAQLGLLF